MLGSNHTDASDSSPVLALASARAADTVLLPQCLSLKSIMVVAIIATLLAVAFTPFYSTPFLKLWARTLIIAACALLAFAFAGWLPQRFLPRWVAQLISLVISIPPASVLAYSVTLGNMAYLFGPCDNCSIYGIMRTALSSLAVAIAVALLSLYVQRDAQARSQALAFALEKETLERQALTAQLKALQAQIEPHFLFNTLANVQQLVESGSPQASPMLRALIGYLRAAVPSMREARATLAQELELVRSYLDLMRVRMPDRLQYVLEIPAPLLGIGFPPMMLLTLAENALKHGIDPSTSGGVITIRAMQANHQLSVEVADTGKGLNPHAPAGTGLANIRERLKALYGTRAQLELVENTPQGVVATLTIPIEPIDA